MRAELGLPSVKEAEPERKKRPISVKFEIPYFTTSGIQVRYLKIIEPKLQYPSLPWVRYISCASGMNNLYFSSCGVFLTNYGMRYRLPCAPSRAYSKLSRVATMEGCFIESSIGI